MNKRKPLRLTFNDEDIVETGAGASSRMGEHNLDETLKKYSTTKNQHKYEKNMIFKT